MASWSPRERPSVAHDSLLCAAYGGSGFERAALALSFLICDRRKRLARVAA